MGNYETNEYKDISHFAIIKLAKFYGVTTDYLLGFSETKKHSKADINSLRLSDEMIDILQQGKLNIPLFCELATHKNFPKLLADIEEDRVGTLIVKNCQRSRWIGGKTYTWMGYSKEVQQTQGVSGLEFDSLHDAAEK